MSKRIIYVHQYFVAPNESGNIRSYLFAKHLVSKGYEVNMITTSQDKEFKGWRYESIEGINVYKCSVIYNNSMGFYSRVRAFVKYIFLARKKAVEVGGDVVFATSTPLTVAAIAIYVKKRLKIPFIFEVRDLWPTMPIVLGYLTNPMLKKMALWLEKKAYKEACHVVALSPGMKKGVLKISPHSDVTVIPNISDIDIMKSSKHSALLYRKEYLSGVLKEGDRLVIYVGTLGFLNGVSYIVKLAAEVLKTCEKVKFLIVGRGKETASVEQLSRELGVYDKNFFMLSSVAKQDISKIYANAALGMGVVLPVPEAYDNSSSKFFDCIASGTPIAINYLGWQKSLVEEACAGMALDQYDFAKAARQLVELLSNDDKLSKMGENALSLAKDFDKNNAMTNIYSIIKKITNESYG